MLLFHALFALGETLLQPTIPAITNDMAPDHLRGRYNAVNAGAFQAGTILGPVVAGFMLNHRWSTAFVAMIVVGCGGDGAAVAHPGAPDQPVRQRPPGRRPSTPSDAPSEPHSDEPASDVASGDPRPAVS